MESTNCLFVPLVNRRSIALTPEMAARRCSASTMGRSSGGQSAFVKAFGCNVDFGAALGAAFFDGFDAVWGGLDDSPIPWGWRMIEGFPQKFQLTRLCQYRTQRRRGGIFPSLSKRPDPSPRISNTGQARVIFQEPSDGLPY